MSKWKNKCNLSNERKDEPVKDFCYYGNQDDVESKDEDCGIDNDTPTPSGNLLDPILPQKDTERRQKLFPPPRHFQENNEFTCSPKPLLYSHLYTKNESNTFKHAKKSKPSTNYIFKIKNSFRQNSLINSRLKSSNSTYKAKIKN